MDVDMILSSYDVNPLDAAAPRSASASAGAASTASTGASSAAASSAVDAPAAVDAYTSGANWPVPGSTVSGRLWIRVVEGRNLLARCPQSRPYCVVEFEKNEFVTKEAMAINGVPTSAAAAAALAAAGSSLHAPPPPLLEQQDSTGSGAGSAAEPGLFPVWRHEASFDVTRSDGEMTVSIWDRMGPNQEEAFLGMMKIRPPRIDGKLHDNWFRLLPRQWNEQISGDIRVQIKYQQLEAKALSANDFELLKVVGRGSFGKVLQVRKKDTGRIYAMKVLVKKEIVERQEVQHTLSERNVLIQATSPFLVGLKYSFQTPEKLYLVLDYMNGGELFYHLQKETAFSEERAKFYVCELILAIEHLHKFNIVYRDLKPENILLDSNGHIALTDFGLCKENVAYDEVTNTFCGTPEYLAPEVLTGVGYGKAVDWWSLGILFYEMTTGLPPFYSENTNLMYKKILHNQLVFPPGFSPLAQSLCQGLLNRDPKQRLGGGPEDSEAIKQHPYFADVDWSRLSKRRVKPPFKPTVVSETDTSNFDPAFTEAMPIDSVKDDTPLSGSVQENFRGFTYTDENQHLAGSAMSSSSMMSSGGGLSSYQAGRLRMQ
ncbi:kinase-like domain-containing protein [Entophlyctis helioformis]|nr:kinase-like domain-containing protein [Entophlyctis helioformis]